MIQNELAVGNERGLDLVGMLFELKSHITNQDTHITDQDDHIAELKSQNNCGVSK